jgi:leucyl aminopeptidase
MLACFLETRPADAIPIIPVVEQTFRDDRDAWLNRQETLRARWIAATGFQAKPGSHCLIPKADGALSAVVVGAASIGDLWAGGALPTQLPAGSYYLDADWPRAAREQFAIGWGLGAYRFTRYKAAPEIEAKLVMDPDGDAAAIDSQVASAYLVRDLINTAAEDMMPEHLAAAIAQVAQDFGATVTQIVGDDLLAKNYPAVHTVGRASRHAPRLIDLRWGNPEHPKVTLVGKGVCFDSGGLDIKPASGMRTMKKDMGGAAHALGVARMVMQAGLPVHLRLLAPAVENAVSGESFRPGDVITSRKGVTIEIDNTDAEGRLILCDALAEGCSEAPEVMIDFATLTGAARVALGTDLPAMFTNSDAMATGLLEAADEAQDPVWRMPLHKPYRSMLDSKVADIANAASAPFGGAITAALFLQEFVEDGPEWAHFDIMAWNRNTQPGRPEGGEAMGMRTVFAYLQRRFDGSRSTP